MFSSGDGPFDVDHIKFNGDKIEVLSAISQINWRYQTTALHRDPSSWYHITVAVDTTNSTASDRVKIYVNGTRVEDFGVSTAPSQNYENNTSNTKQHAIGYDVGNIGYTYGGYMADVYFIDGSALTPVDNFIELDSNGVYQRKDYTGSFGTNGFHLLDFANESTVGHDSSGNNNDFTANNISSSGTDTDVLLDYPKNGDSNNDSGAGGQVNGNYAVMNPMDSQSSLTLSNGNLDVSNTANSLRNSRATIAYPATGKWYYEYTPGGSANMAIGIADSLTSLSAENSGTFVTYHQDGAKNVNGTKTASAFASYTSGDIIGVLYDSDANSVSFYKNNSLQGSITPTSGTTYFPFIITYNTTGSFNFGSRAFEYTAPSSAKPLCTTLLPTPTIGDGSDYFDIDLYTGTGSTHERSEFSFSPDFVWIKQRNTTRNNLVFDIVRGVNKFAVTNSTGTPGTGTGMVTSFDSDGFTVGTSADVNQSSGTFCAWCWDAGSSTVSNTDGSQTTSVRANATAGFSIVQGANMTSSQKTFGHGLSAAPEMIWGKRLGANEDWNVYHKDLTSNKMLVLNDNTGEENSNFSGTPTSSVFTYYPNADSYIFYCFAPVDGYQALGQFTGNADSNGNGPFVHTGFAVKWLLIKGANDSNDNWKIFDASRSTFNVADDWIATNNNNAEVTSNNNKVDLLSNGFRIRTTGGGDSNLNNKKYIYLAIASNPFQLNGGLAR